MNQEQIILRTLKRETSFDVPFEKLQAIFEKYRDSPEMKELQKERQNSQFNINIKINLNEIKGLDNFNSLNENEPA